MSDVGRLGLNVIKALTAKGLTARQARNAVLTIGLDYDPVRMIEDATNWSNLFRRSGWWRQMRGETIAPRRNYIESSLPYPDRYKYYAMVDIWDPEKEAVVREVRSTYSSSALSKDQVEEHFVSLPSGYSDRIGNREYVRARVFGAFHNEGWSW